jgi:uncharacterized protein DUF4956
MPDDLPNFLVGAAFNLSVAIIIVRFIYYPVTQDKRYVLSFLAFNTIIFFVLQFLTNSNLTIGVGFGLFAIFSVLNYRTDEMPIREMTYLFTVIALPVMNSFLTADDNLASVVIANAIVVTLLFVLEHEWGFRYQTSKKLTYEIIDNIRPENHEALLADLRRRTGLDVQRVEVGRIDFLRDTAELKVYYDELKGSPVRSDMSVDPARIGSD